ncbi:ribonuclease H-like domain-containing protein [Tanacetum coccineum]
MAIDDPSGSNNDSVNGLDGGNPLHMNPNDSTSISLIPFKLLGTENYRIWNSAMKLALQARNKYAFVDVVLTWIMNSVSVDVYMGLVYSVDAATVWKDLESTYDKMIVMSVRSSLLTRDPLPEVKDAYVIVSRGIPESSSNYGMIGHTIERCYELIGYPPGFKKVANPIKQTGFKQGFNANIDVTNGFKQGFNANIDVKSNDKQYIHANMADSGANQHLTVSTVGMSNIVDISNLKITVGHPNGTLATVSHVGNLQLTRNVVLYDVLVVPEYYDLKKEITLGTGSKSCGLYLFDLKSDKNIGNVNMVHAFNVSKSLWHIILSHPADQVLVALKNHLNLSKSTVVSAYEVSHRAKQTREPFPLSDYKSEKVGDLIHLDLWGLYRVARREGFKYFFDYC